MKKSQNYMNFMKNKLKILGVIPTRLVYLFLVNNLMKLEHINFVLSDVNSLAKLSTAS